MGRSRKLSYIGWAFCFSVLFWAPGCRGQTTPAFLEERPNPAWLSQQSERWAQAEAVAPRDETVWPETIRYATVSGDRILWVTESEGVSQLWTATMTPPLSTSTEPGGDPLAQKTLLLRREYPDAIISATLSPDGRRALLRTNDNATTHRESQCSLELVDLGSPGKTQRLSSVASLYFMPAWCATNAFLWAEMGTDNATVYRQTVNGERRQILSHQAPYARLLLQRLEPQGWMIVDRNDPMITHCWISPLADPTESWQEIRVEGQRARPMGWYQDRLLVVSRSGTDTSEVLLIPARPDREGWAWDKADILLTTRPIDNAFFSADRLLFLSQGEWGQRLKTLDLKTRVCQELKVEVDPFLGGAFQPIDSGRALLMMQGPFQPRSCYLVTANPAALHPLLKPKWSLPPHEFQVSVTHQRIRISPSKTDSQPDRRPVLLESYGAFDQTPTANFDPFRLEWLRLGGEVVIAPLRGRARQHGAIVTQLLRVAQSLGPRPISYRGQSFGGTLGLMAMQRQDHAFAAVLADAPLTDLLHFTDYPPGETWIPEFGDPEDPSERERLRALSPLENIPSGSHPPLIVSTSLDDPVVNSYHALTYVERAQSRNGNAIILFKEQRRGAHDRLEWSSIEQAAMARVLWSISGAGSGISSGKTTK